VATGAYLAAVYLAGDSQRAGLPDLVRAFRARALGAAIVAGAMAIGGLAVVRSDARHLYDGLTSDAGLAFVLASALAGLVTIGLVWRGRFEPARYTGAAAVAAIGAGWLAAQWPDLLPGELTVEQAAAGKETLAVLLIGVAIGAILLVPSLWYLFRLVLSGRLDKEFHPITAGEEPPRD
jgi:cytochrome bd ubiquinol oxidase subunit II